MRLICCIIPTLGDITFFFSLSQVKNPFIVTPMNAQRLQVVSRHTVKATGAMASNERPPITVHILDTSTGRPAVDVSITLSQFMNGTWRELKQSVTNEDGRCQELTQPGSPAVAGLYKMRFETEPYFEKRKQATFYPYIEIVFEIAGDLKHYHIPLLLSPYGYTTYRGS